MHRLNHHPIRVTRQQLAFLWLLAIILALGAAACRTTESGGTVSAFDNLRLFQECGKPYSRP